MKEKRDKNRIFEVGVPLIIVTALLISGISIVSGVDFIKKSSPSLSKTGLENINPLLSPLAPHPIYGTATWEGGGNADGASVAVTTSSLGTLSTTVSSGAWQVDCGDPGPNWPSGTGFTVTIAGSGSHTGWYGSASGSVSGYYNDMGNIVVYDNDPPGTPSTPSGSTSGQTGQSYSYSTSASDPDNNQVYYWLDWGDSTDSGWVGPYSSGQTGSASHSWSSANTYNVQAKAKDTHNEVSGWSSNLIVTISAANNPPNTPSNPNPPNNATLVELNANLSWVGGDPDSGDTVTYDVYFGSMPPLQKVASNISTPSYNPGTLANSLTYFWNVVARDNHGFSTVGPSWHFTTTDAPNNPPNKPNKPSGQNKGKLGVEYSYTTSTTDPDEDQVYYLWDWGDETNSEWLGPYTSGVTAGVTHNWTVKGSYNIKVKVKDILDAESPWSDPLPITMPYSFNRPLFQFLELLFQRFPHAFPLLRQVSGY